MELEFSVQENQINLISNLELMKQNLDQKNMLFTHIVEKFWMLLRKVRRMELKLFNGIIMEERINYSISVSPITLHHLHQKWIDYDYLS